MRRALHQGPLLPLQGALQTGGVPAVPHAGHKVHVVLEGASAEKVIQQGSKPIYTSLQSDTDRSQQPVYFCQIVSDSREEQSK